MKLFHPDRFAHEPEKQETYHKLTAAINHAKDHGDLATLRRIAEDPHGFILRQGWAALDFGEEREIAQLRRMWTRIELEIIRVLEAQCAQGEPRLRTAPADDADPGVFRRDGEEAHRAPGEGVEAAGK